MLCNCAPWKVSLTVSLSLSSLYVPEMIAKERMLQTFILAAAPLNATLRTWLILPVLLEAAGLMQ